ncbi:hypothetical protein [Deinococcus saxicola]|uniref:hypothetical protein n=1 Tax=Deinococcus saxicola TaxID=249406 RepID=UPI0039F02D91
MSLGKPSLKGCGPLIWSCGAAWADPAPATACDNTLNPVQAGWVWTYRVTPGDTRKTRLYLYPEPGGGGRGVSGTVHERRKTS